VTKRDLVKALSSNERKESGSSWQREGLTYKQLEEIVDVVFDSIAGALRRGEMVYLPLGILEVIDQPRRPVRGWFLDRVRVTYKRRRVIKFTPGEFDCE
jgi:nucleoid DNA-binding protein